MSRHLIHVNVDYMATEQFARGMPATALKTMTRCAPIALFVVPCYNEEAVLDQSISTLLAELELLGEAGLCSLEGSGVLLVDDGSGDATWQLIEDWSCRDSRVSGLRLSRNKGHQPALLAGLVAVADYADVSISIDADLQDDVSVCNEMLSLYKQGYDIVYGVRGNRSTDSRSKRFFANSFYSLMLLMGVEIMPGHADFRLMSRRSLVELLRYKERSLFLRGMIPQLGYKTASVHYSRKVRERGVSKYPFRKSLALAVDGVISLSYKPLRYIAYLGIFMALLSGLSMIAIVVSYLLGVTIQGWASLMVVVTVMGGVQLLALGLIGEYLARVYTEVKHRPLYHLQARTGLLFQGPSPGSVDGRNRR
jgi:glycosyltransferase involved in cell wall biosynthesis